MRFLMKSIAFNQQPNNLQAAKWLEKGKVGKTVFALTTCFRNSRCADYVNLADFCVIRDSVGGSEEPNVRSSLPYLYSDVTRVKSEQPDVPHHRPFMKWVHILNSKLN